MSTLTLVRHGQASWLQETYDRLSPAGMEQARLLGEYWAGRRVRIDRAFSGPAARHRETANGVAEAFRMAGLSFPEVVTLPELDEYDWEPLIRDHLLTFADAFPDVQEAFETFQSAVGMEPRSAAFQRVFQTVMKRWVLDGFRADGCESWPAFTRRVEAGLHHIRSTRTPGEHAVAFTSGGPIGAILQIALDTGDETMLRLCWTVRNTSLTECLCTEGLFSLNTFNMLPHLSDPALWTWR